MKTNKILLYLYFLTLSIIVFSQKTFPTQMSYTFSGGNNMGAAIGNDCGLPTKDIDIQFNSIDGNMEITVKKICHVWSFMQHWMGNPYAASIVFKNRYMEFRVQSGEVHNNAALDTNLATSKGLYIKFQVSGGNPNGSLGKYIPCVPYKINEANTWEIKFFKLGGNADTVFKEIDYFFDNGFYKIDYVYYGDKAVPPVPTIDMVKDKNVMDNAGVQNVTLTGIEIPGRLYDGLTITAKAKTDGFLKDVAIVDLGGGSGIYIDEENKSATLKYTPVNGMGGNSDSIIVTLTDTIRNTTKKMAFKVTLLSSGSCTTAVPSAADVGICYGKKATLTASGGINYRWYSSLTSSFAIGTDSIFTTPALGNNVTYYVANYNGICESSRKAVQVFITNQTSVKINSLPSGILTPTSAPIQLTANVPGGIFSGDGVQNGYFVPAMAKKNQLNMIYYDYGVTGCKGRDSMAVFVFPGTDIREPEKNIMEIFPNPGNGVFTIEMDGIQGVVAIQIIDETGRIVLENKSNADDTFSQIFDMTAFPKGLYIVKASLANQIIYSKIVLK